MNEREYITPEWLLSMGFEKSKDLISLKEFYHIHGIEFMQMRRGYVPRDKDGKMIGDKKLWFVDEIITFLDEQTGQKLK